MWFDSHCHLSAAAFDEDREEALARAREGGVETFVAIGAGYGLDEIPGTVALAERHGDVYATAGVHPHDARLLDEEGHRTLRHWLAHPRVLAVGECGLDYHYDHSPRDVQCRVFGEQVRLARELDLPVVIHVRGDGDSAYDDLLAIWESEGAGCVSGVLHCYTHDLPFARRALDHGLMISFSGILTFKRAGDLRDVARALPLEELLVETDAPFLAPEGFRGKRNEPARVARVGEVLAECQKQDVEAIAAATTANARRFYRLDR